MGSRCCDRSRRWAVVWRPISRVYRASSVQCNVIGRPQPLNGVTGVTITPSGPSASDATSFGTSSQKMARPGSGSGQLIFAATEFGAPGKWRSLVVLVCAKGAKIGLIVAEKGTAHPTVRMGRVYLKACYSLRVAIDACAVPRSLATINLMFIFRTSQFRPVARSARSSSLRRLGL